VLLDQLASQAARLTRDFHIDLRLRAVMTSRAMALADSAIPLDAWRAAIRDGQPPDMLRFEDHVNAEHLPHAVILDCSASDEVAEPVIRAGSRLAFTCHARTSAPTADLSICTTSLPRGAAGRRDRTTSTKATVGRRLPIIQTLRDLRETGDDIRRIEGNPVGHARPTCSSVGRTAAVFRDRARREGDGYTEPRSARRSLRDRLWPASSSSSGREMGLCGSNCRTWSSKG
jgi:aspartokinase/homoserine dehydrogenase 1